jgi:hypothetical protein
VQVQSEPWDYGDSDDGFVLPLASALKENTGEWCRWLSGDSGSVAWFQGPPNLAITSGVKTLPEGWRLFPETGIAVNRSGEWFLRWDVSPLGYLQTAAHAHLDALHLSIWIDDSALVIDPGTWGILCRRGVAELAGLARGAQWPRVGGFATCRAQVRSCGRVS